MTLRHVWPIAGAIALASSVLVSIRAEERRRMTLIDLAEIPRVLDTQLAPDGRSISYTLARADWRANRQVSHVWRQEITGGAPVQLTRRDAGETTSRWSPDSRTLLFVSRAEQGAQIFLVSSDGGEPHALTHHASGISGAAAPVWSPDGSTIFFLASDPPLDSVRDRTRAQDDVYAFEEDFAQRHLWKVAVATGVEQRVTSGGFSVVAFRLSRDGRTIVHHRAPTPLAADSYKSEVWLMDADSGHARALTSNRIEESEAELSPDNRQVMFLAETNDRLEPYYSSTIFLVPAEGGTPQPVLSDFPYTVEHASWAPDGRALLAVVNMGVHSEVVRIDLDRRDRRSGKPEPPKQLTDGRHSVQFWSVAPAASRMVFQLDEPTRLGDVWTLPLDGGQAVRVTGVYDTLDPTFDLPRQEKVSWRGTDGVTVEGVIFYPVGYDPGKSYPLVVQLHGGPVESDKFGYGPGFIANYVPVLAARGYLVLRPNYRGSAGYGSAFMRDVVGNYFNHMHLDVLAGVDFLVRQGVADPARLAVMGWSAGGHLTNKLITYTDRFKAASSTAGAANWTSMFAQTDTREGRQVWFGGSPWQKNAPAAFWNSSPLKDAARVKTPTLLIASENDSRVPMAQAVEMFRALTANGVPTRLYVAPREGHQWGELRHQLFKANAELEWFERYVTGRSYNWERAPDDTVRTTK